MAGAPATKASRLVSPGESIHVMGPPPRFVGRGGEKLAAALETFGVDLGSKRVLDAGASTGGFTDCALQVGASRVVAVDVGRGQIHQRLRSDPRVEVLERTNVRHLQAGQLGDPFDVIVADLSFISLRVVAPALIDQAGDGAELIWLVKPQFEAGKQEVSRFKGVITDPEIWRRTLQEVATTIEQLGGAIMGVMPSPLKGADGNVEFLIYAMNKRPLTDSAALLDAAVDAVTQ